MLQLALVAAALHDARGQSCLSGAAPAACDSVLIVHADPLALALDVQASLRGTGAFVTVDLFDARSGTPTAAQLASYHAVLAYSNYRFSDSMLLGDRLATYHDQGGGVVVAMIANAGNNSVRLQGVYGTVASGYCLLDYSLGGYSFSPNSLGDLVEPQSPLLTGVAAFAATDAYRSTAPVVSGRGVVVARWRSGGMEPLLLRGARGNRTLVELNFAPFSSKVYNNFWTGDGAALLRNALKYSRCMLCGPGTFAAAGLGLA